MEVETDRLACPLKPYIPNRVDVWVCTEQRSPSDQTTYVDTAHCVAQGQSPRLDRSILHRRHASLSTQSSVTQEGHVLLHQEKKKTLQILFSFLRCMEIRKYDKWDPSYKQGCLLNVRPPL